MENISSIEKNIIDYFLEIDSLEDKINRERSENKSNQHPFTKWNAEPVKDLADRKLPKVPLVQMAYGRFSTNTEDLLKFLLTRDESLKQLGVKIDREENPIEPKLIVLRNEGKDSQEQANIGLLYQKLSYVLTKIPRFLNQLEHDGYIDRVSIKKEFLENSTERPIVYFNCNRHSEFIIEINDREVINNFLNFLKYYFVPTYKLYEFKKNGYFTTDLQIAKNELLLSKQNLRLAKVGLYTAIFSALTSLVAIVLTLYSIGIPASVRIDQAQFNSLIKLIKLDQLKPVVIDSTLNKNNERKALKRP